MKLKASRKELRKPEPAPSNVRTKKPDKPGAITPIEYGEWQTAFDHFNQVLFDGALPDVFITYQSHAHSRGHFSPDRFSARDGKSGNHELALNPDAFIDRTDEQIVSTLTHEMTHLWQQVFGKPAPSSSSPTTSARPHPAFVSTVGSSLSSSSAFSCRSNMR